MANKRITEQTTDSALVTGDYVIVDSQSEGTRKFDLGGELTDIKSDITELQEELLGVDTLVGSGVIE